MANQFDDSVTVLDASHGALVATVPTGQWPTGVNVHPGGERVYVANALDDTMSVIDVQTGTVRTVIPVADGAVAVGEFIVPRLRSEDALGALLSTVKGLVETGTLTSLQAARLIQSLERALSALQSGNIALAIRSLQLFQQLIRIQSSPLGLLSETEGALLGAGAERVAQQLQETM